MSNTRSAGLQFLEAALVVFVGWGGVASTVLLLLLNGGLSLAAFFSDTPFEAAMRVGVGCAVLSVFGLAGVLGISLLMTAPPSFPGLALIIPNYLAAFGALKLANAANLGLLPWQSFLLACLGLLSLLTISLNVYWMLRNPH